MFIHRAYSNIWLEIGLFLLKLFDSDLGIGSKLNTMSQLNILAYRPDKKMQQQCSRILDRFFKPNIPFFVEEWSEAEHLLERVNISLAVFSIDNQKMDIQGLAKRFPHIQFIGVHEQFVSGIPFEEENVRFIHRDKLSAELFGFFRGLKKKRSQGQPDRSYSNEIADRIKSLLHTSGAS